LEYRRFEIGVRKFDDGYLMTSYRLSDEWMLIDEYNHSIKTKAEAIKECKITIDDYYDNPEDYED